MMAEATHVHEELFSPLTDLPLSACVIVVLDHDAPSSRGLDVILSQRSFEKDKFLSGFHAFPGGRFSPEEQRMLDDGERSLLDVMRHCAIRELYEELGLLCLSGRGCISELSSPEIDAWQRAALLGDEVATSRYMPVGRWFTPEWAPLRFETEFFLLLLDRTESRHVRQLLLEDGKAPRARAMMTRAEIERCEARPPMRWLELHEQAEILLSLPTIEYLEELAAPGVQDALKAAIEQKHPLVFVRQQRDCVDPSRRFAHTADTWMVPLATATLPPATHTNAYVIGDEERFVVIDPGASTHEDMAPLYALMDRLLELGATCQAIVLTHHHDDHISGVPLLGERYGVEKIAIWAHEKTLELCAKVLDPEMVTRSVEHGELLDVSVHHTLEVLFTPGHAPGHIALLHRESASIFCGDLVASQGTILVAPPHGDMADYMQSLEMVRALDPGVLHPAHGWPIARPDLTLDEYITHRHARERQVLEALAASAERGAMAAIDLVPAVYEELPEHFWPLAALSLEAHLVQLAARHANVTRESPEAEVPGRYRWKEGAA